MSDVAMFHLSFLSTCFFHFPIQRPRGSLCVPEYQPAFRTNISTEAYKCCLV
jgi:hypothetical protein